MKLLFILVANTFGYGSNLTNSYFYVWNPHFRKKEMLVTEIFIRSLVEKYGRHTVYTDDGTWYHEACNVIGLKHYLHLSLEKSLMERVINSI
jgi:hypothetical protein